MFRSEFFFRTTQELEYLFFLSREARIFFPEFNNRLYDKNSESDYFFFPPPKSKYFFQQHWESEYFFRKKNITPPFKLNGRSLKQSRYPYHLKWKITEIWSHNIHQGTNSEIIWVLIFLILHWPGFHWR